MNWPIARFLPPGTVPVGGGLAVLGISAYLHLAVAGHLLTPADFSSLSVLWAIVFTLDLGLFMPVEQEISRHVATLRVRGLPYRAVLARFGLVIAGVLGLLSAVILASAGPLADRLFGGDTTLPWSLCATLAGLALAHTSRGMLAGLGLFRRYGTQLGLDGALRISLVLALAVGGVTSVSWYAMPLALAPLAAAALTVSGSHPAGSNLPGSHAAATTPTGRGRGCAPVAVGWRPLLGGLGLLTISSLLAQFVANVGVINVRLLAPAETAVAGALLAALVLARIPLFLFASVQAPLLPGLAASLASGNIPRFHALLRRALGIVSVLGAAVGVPVVLVGPWLVGALFDAPAVLTSADFGWLAAGSLGYLWAMVLGQGLLAQRRHLGQAAAWSAGAAALTAVTLLPLPVVPRVEIGYAAAAIVTAGGMAVLLRRDAPAPRRNRNPVRAVSSAAGAGPG